MRQKLEVQTYEAEAFGRGSDDRLAGLPLSDCPYEDKKGKSAWRLGWRDVDRNWAKDRRFFWPPSPLTPVAGAA